MDIKKVKLNNKICDVTTLECYVSNKTVYDPQYTAIELENYVLPIIGKLDNRVGINVGDMVSFYNLPSDENKDEYLSNNIIDFDKAKNMSDLIRTQEYVKSLENEILVNSDNVFEPRIDDDDSPEMKALKEAVISKQIDIDVYAKRFNGNFANDKRLFNYNEITLRKLKKIAEALDMRCTLVIEDQSPDVPNPIGKIITIDITGGDDDEEDAE